MPRLNASFSENARANYTIRSKDIAEVLSHRKDGEYEEYLVRWITGSSAFPRPPRAPLSWHLLPELYDALHHVQIYLENCIQDLEPQRETATDHFTSLPANRKRKAGEGWLSRDGLLTPDSDRSRSVSESQEEKATISTTATGSDGGPQSYNVVLQKKAGRLLRKKWPKDTPTVSTARLPDNAMLRVAATSTTSQAEKAIRYKFLEMLKPVKGVSLENTVDKTTPSLNFTFVENYVFREGIEPTPLDFYEGCDKCQPNMGQNIGCEYTQKCSCLEYAAVDEQRLRSRYPDLYNKYIEAKKGNGFIGPDLPKRFPYTAPNKEDRSIPQTLVPYYLEQRHAIYECNDNCRCGPRCKSRVVQKGRRVGLTIFKTETRGWGVYCNENLVRGEFIDTYLGEVITGAEADKRENQGGQAKNSYLYNLDKFVGDPIDNTALLTKDQCHVVDGQYLGGPTRFINHSCEPNCRQYTVSYNKNDLLVYHLAFFAYQEIPAGTELTFDYMDLDETELDDAIKEREAAIEDPANADKIKCNCGAPKCRGFLWRTN